MMKIIRKICLCLTLLMVVLCCFNKEPLVLVNASSEAELTKTIEENIKKELLDLIEDGKISTEKTRSGRIPGSPAEYNMAMYLKQKLTALKNFKAVNNASTINGVEEFDFECVFDGNMYSSQNIIFKRESLIETDRKIILSAHYDTMYVFNEGKIYSDFESVVGDGVNDNAAAIAVLLSLVNNLDKMPLDFGYDVEVVFFGASTNNYDGSRYYNRGQSDEDAKNTLLVVNLDKIALGDYNYVYVNEFESPQEKYILNRLYGFKKLQNINTIDSNKTSPNGLDYTHVGLESDHAIFMKRNVNVVSFFSGNYESKLTPGFNEYSNKDNITFTENDSYVYLNLYYEGFFTNLTKIYKAVNNLISHDKFISNMEKNNGLDEKYEFWTNEKMAAFITSILLVVAILIYLIIYNNLKTRSQEVLNSAKIEDIVVKISSNLLEPDNQDLNDAIDQKIKKDTTKDELEDK